MATYDGVLIESGFSAIPDFDQYSLADKDPSLEILAVVGQDVNDGAYSRENAFYSPVTYDGRLIEGGYESIYNRIWIIPSSFDFRLISYTKSYDVLVWNAKQQALTLDSFGSQGDVTGCAFEETPPISFAINQEVTLGLEVLREGNFQINGDVTLTFSEGSICYLSVLGLRLLFPLGRSFLSDHNWADGIEVIYSFQSLITQSKKFYEQRAQLFPQMRRRLMISVLQQRPLVKNYLMYGANSVFAIPMFTEPILLAIGELDGLTSLTATNDISYYYNLKNLTDLLVICKDNQILVRGITGVSGQNILLDTALITTWRGEEVICYPVISCFVEALKFDYLNSKTWKGNYNMQEYVYG